MKELKQFLMGFRRGLESFGNNITIIINSVLLFIAYFIGIGFTAILAKLTRKHFIERKLSNKKSYWSDLNLKKKPIEKYYRQF